MQRGRFRTSRIDYTLLLLLLLLFLSSCFAIYSAQTTGQYGENFLLKQIVWYIVGSGLIVGIIGLDSDQLRKISWFVYGFGVFTLALLVVAPESIAPTINGAKSWFRFPGIGSIQPSEFMKVFLILALSNTILTHNQKHQIKTTQTDLLLLVKLGVVTGMIFVSGITWKLLVPIFGSMAAIGATLLILVVKAPEFLEKYLGVKQYQFGRIYSWLDPETYQSSTGYQLSKSLLAIGSGQTSGKGFGNRDVYLPESQTDFIFSVIGEEFGFIGASFVISLFFLLIYHIMKMAMDTKNQFYTYICVGVISMIGFHVFQNVGMTIGVMPITGIPLPFISYGGSALLGNMMALGLIFSIAYHFKRYMFSTEK